MIAIETDEDIEKIEAIFEKERYYLTPKLDVRVACFQDDKILLVRERTDNKWSLPGGWADVNQSPSECAIREIKEESGYDVNIIKLFAFIDKRKRNFPPQVPHAYKCLYLAEITGACLLLQA